MKIINFGSLNIDHVYRVDHIVKPGETLDSSAYTVFAGGKGANQSIAIARAGGTVTHVGKVGREGVWMVENMEKDGVDVSRIAISPQDPGGHAIIQVDKKGQNSIFLFGGTNHSFTKKEIDAALAGTHVGDLILLQNEINDIDYILKQASRRKLIICFNPAPMTAAVKKLPLALVTILIVNETEGEALSGKKEPVAIIKALRLKYPHSAFLLTLGKNGLLYADEEGQFSLAACKVKAVDTTAAGDCFVGYFLASVQQEMSLQKALARATRAAAISVSRQGASSSIPCAREVIV